MLQSQSSAPTPASAGVGVVRLLTDDVDLLLPALAQRGASFWITGARRIDIRGLHPADVAELAALLNARVTDLQALAG